MFIARWRTFGSAFQWNLTYSSLGDLSVYNAHTQIYPDNFLSIAWHKAIPYHHHINLCVCVCALSTALFASVCTLIYWIWEIVMSMTGHKWIPHVIHLDTAHCYLLLQISRVPYEMPSKISAIEFHCMK